MSAAKPTIAVVDYGMGNLRSVAQALRAVAPEADVRISGAVAEIDGAEQPTRYVWHGRRGAAGFSGRGDGGQQTTR